jgi:alpha/beta superfamily hydrolase
MNIPKLPVQTKPFLWGATAGAVALAIVGFNWGGWVTGAGAEKLAGARADAAIVSSLTPICIAQFKASAKAPANLAALKETKSWEQVGYVEKGGWATMPGSTADPNRQVATACAEALDKLIL